MIDDIRKVLIAVALNRTEKAINILINMLQKEYKKKEKKDKCV